jgi:superfamily II DNA or RNA helicase
MEVIAIVRPLFPFDFFGQLNQNRSNLCPRSFWMVCFAGLRIPQCDALAKLRAAFKSGKNDFLVVLPTGCGKTIVMALAPFTANAMKVLVVTPTVLIKQQVNRAINDIFDSASHGHLPHPIGRAVADGKVHLTIGAYENSLKASNRSDIIVANVHQLVVPKKPASADAKGKIVLRPVAEPFINGGAVDYVIVDEAHHMDAQSWKVVRGAVRAKNPNAKFVFLTATPQRLDKERPYGITDEDQLYLYTRKEAMTADYIRRTTPHPVVLSPEFTEILEGKKGRRARGAAAATLTRKDVYKDQRYIKEMMTPAMELLQKIRGACGGSSASKLGAKDGEPLRMLVTASTNDDAKALAAEINTLSKEMFGDEPHFHAEHITAKSKDKDDFEFRFSCDRSELKPGTKLIDIGVHCQMMSEGYDNNWIIISAFVAPPDSLPRLSQLHGRAIRMSLTLKDLGYVQSNMAHVFFPKTKHLESLVEAYLNGDDEDTKKILAPPGTFQSTKHAHMEVRKLRSAEGAILMQREFENYHDLYEAKRESWKPIPAEKLAEIVFKDLIEKQCVSNDGFACNIVDFGCGRDGLFEIELAAIVEGTLDHARGSVEVLAVDVERPRKECTTDLHTNKDGMNPGEDLQFRCASAVCNYTEIKSNSEYQAWSKPTGEPPKVVDAAVHCLSLMTEDAIPEGLIVAMEIVKPGGVVYIVLDKFKFGSVPRADPAYVQNKIMDKWMETFNEHCHGIVTATCLNYNKTDYSGLGSGMIYLQLKVNVGFDEASKAKLYAKLRGPPEKTLVYFETIAKADREIYLDEHAARRASSASSSASPSQPPLRPPRSPGPTPKRQKVDE